MKVQVILGSTRPGRVGLRIAKLVMQQSANRGAEFELVDLADYDLPRFNEDMPPRAQKDRAPKGEVGRWVKKVAEADGYVIVTPEYNYSFPGILKDALDFVDYQMLNKPVAIVSYGVNGGVRAQEHLKNVILGVKAVAVPDTTALNLPVEFVDENGHVKDESQAVRQLAMLDTTLNGIVRWSELVSAKEATPST